MKKLITSCIILLVCFMSQIMFFEYFGSSTTTANVANIIDINLVTVSDPQDVLRMQY